MIRSLDAVCYAEKVKVSSKIENVTVHFLV
jgi:hypothetical protein